MVVAQAAPPGDPGPPTLIAASFPEGWRPADHHVSGDPVESDDAHVDSRGVIHRDNTFGTPEEDAFRRDFTINALFYDVATKSVIDYVGGLEDLRIASSARLAIRTSALRKIPYGCSARPSSARGSASTWIGL